MFVELNK